MSDIRGYWRATLLRRTGRLRSEAGQVLVLAVLTLPVLLGMAAMVVDYGNLVVQRRVLQSSADAAVLAAAQELAADESCTDACVADLTGKYSGRNTGAATLTPLAKCPGSGSQSCYTWPYVDPAGVSDPGRVSVTLKTSVPTLFARILGVTKVPVSARAVAGVTAGAPPPYSFVALNESCNNHSLILKVGGKLNVDSGIFVNSCDDHDGFDIKGTGGHLTAPTITTTGGWEIENGTETVTVGGINCPPLPAPWTNPYKYYYNDPSLAPPKSNAPLTPGCPLTGQPPITDPFGKITEPIPGDPALGSGPSLANCTGSSSLGTPSSPKACGVLTGTVTLQPGTYYGGICIGAQSGTSCNAACTSGNANVTLAPGTYVMAGGGFRVCGSSSVSAPNVLIYNTNDSAAPSSASGKIGQIELNTTGSVKLGPQTSGTYRGLTILQDPDLSVDAASGHPHTGCGQIAPEDADIALLSLGPDTVTASTTLGPAVSFPGAGDEELTSAMSSVSGTVTFIPKKSLISFPDPPNVIEIDDEWMRVTDVATVGSGASAHDVVTVVRGEYPDHPVAAHANKTKILRVPSNTTTTTTPGNWLGLVSGTIYAPNPTAKFATMNVRGTANIAVLTGCIHIEGGDQTFTFQPGGLFGLGQALTE